MSISVPIEKEEIMNRKTHGNFGSAPRCATNNMQAKGMKIPVIRNPYHAQGQCSPRATLSLLRRPCA